MKCLVCSSDTRVVNSRPSKKTPAVWRRRRCTACQTTFTTTEVISDTTYPLSVKHSDGHAEPFSLPQLMVSFFQVFGHHDVPTASEESYWLASTVAQEVQATATDHTTTHALAQMAYDVLIRYDEAAGTQYGVRHGVITLRGSQKPRRGRPRRGP